MYTIYTTNWCPYCQKAKQLLQDEGLDFKEIDLTNNPKMLEEISQKSGMQTVPQIFLSDKCLGGFDDLQQLQKHGKL